ncbi:MAG: biotin synthase BioB [Emcibacter sp.]|nr:biotin synthase BioB [Emcibacter sp.]
MSVSSEQVSNIDSPYPDGFRHNWTKKEILEFFDLPMMDLLFQAQTVHRKYFDPNRVQLSQLCSIKTGGCPEDCKYCPQSSRYQTDVDAERLMAVEKVLEGARTAKANGATRYCMGAAWRSPKDRDMAAVVDMIKGVKDLGLESCMTLGMLDSDQAATLKEAGLDYYNHNVDSSPEYYKEIITTRTYQDRLDTLENVRGAGLNVCSGGIVGMGESKADRAGMLQTLVNLPQHPGSVPINMLVQVEGTPLYGKGQMDPFDFIRTIAVARILMPASYVRLSAGREAMSDEMQAMCFMAGANSIFYGEKLLTTTNPQQNTDLELFARLGITPEGQ